ncbi:pygopus homolog 1-like [Clavelina lepadiformis]|uniref:pygopus homolog 1-like n=1 Tax=Clavelina lepadiformis TaxID=159417 RepID=UPI0040424EF8
MPKKKDSSESKKSRKSSSASKDVTSSSPGVGDIVPPPNPAATHLVASNPFDDPPPRMMTSFPNQSMMRMPGQSPGMGPGYPGWNPRAGMRPFNAGGAPSWGNPMATNNNIPSHPAYNQNIPNNGYGMNRPHYLGGPIPFRGSNRMAVNNIRPGIGPLGSPGAPENMMHDSTNMGPNHMVSSGNQGHMLQNTGQMKALTRPPAQLPSPNPTSARKGSTSSNKNVSGESKSPKSLDGNVKQRKKSEKKSSLEGKKSSSDSSDKQSLNSTNTLDSIVAVAPHSIPPELPQVCKSCRKEINYPTEDVVRCIASCNKWYHRTCVGLSESALKLLKMEELALWACDHCLQTKEIYSVKPRTTLLDTQLAAA